MRDNAAYRVIRGLGSVLGAQFDPRKELVRELSELPVNEETYAFVNSTGWKRVSARYRAIIDAQERVIKKLRLDAVANAREIQRRSDLVNACEIMLDVTTHMIQEYDNALKQKQETARQQGLAVAR